MAMNEMTGKSGMTPEQMIAKAMDPQTVIREGEMPMKRTVVRESEQMTDKSLNNMSTPMMLDFINDMPEDMKEAMMALISTGTDFATALDIVRGNDKFVAPSPEMRANEMGALGRLMEEAIDPRSVVREGEQMMPKQREDMLRPAMQKGIEI